MRGFAESWPITKRCNGPCGRELPLSAFSLRAGAPHDRNYDCRECRAEAKKKRTARKAQEKEEKERTTRKATQRNDQIREQRRDEMAAQVAAAILGGTPIAAHAKGLIFRLKRILRDQLELHGSARVGSIAGRARLAKALDLFEFALTGEFSRFRNRLNEIERDEVLRSAAGALILESTGVEREEALRVLGLPPEATAEEIKAVYLARARVVHPDHGGDTHEMQRINAAYKALSEEKENGLGREG